MLPTQVASVLGLDRQLTLYAAARPLTDDQVTDTGMEPIAWEMTARDDAPTAQRLVKVVSFTDG